MKQISEFITKTQEFFRLAKTLEEPFLQHVAKKNTIVITINIICLQIGIFLNLLYKQPDISIPDNLSYFKLCISLIVLCSIVLILQNYFKKDNKKLYWFHLIFVGTYLLWTVIFNCHELQRFGEGTNLTLIITIIFISTIFQFRPQHIVCIEFLAYAMFFAISHEMIIDKLNNIIIVFVAIIINFYFYYFEIKSVDSKIKIKEISEELEQNRITSSKEYLKRIKDSQMQTAVYHHDLRHSLRLMEQLALNGDIEKLQAFVLESNKDYEKPDFYCDNETVNLILGSFNQRAEKENVNLKTEILLPEELSIEDVELCSLLSNLLENALNGSVTEKNIELRNIFIKAIFNDNQLVISVENNFFGEILIENGIPVTKRNTDYHGYGIQSIIDITEKYDGIYSFETEKEMFCIKILLHI